MQNVFDHKLNGDKQFNSDIAAKMKPFEIFSSIISFQFLCYYYQFHRVCYVPKHWIEKLFPKTLTHFCNTNPIPVHPPTHKCILEDKGVIISPRFLSSVCLSIDQDLKRRSTEIRVHYFCVRSFTKSKYLCTIPYS